MTGQAAISGFITSGKDHPGRISQLICMYVGFEILIDIFGYEYPRNEIKQIEGFEWAYQNRDSRLLNIYDSDYFKRGDVIKFEYTKSKSGIPQDAVYLEVK